MSIIHRVAQEGGDVRAVAASLDTEAGHCCGQLALVAGTLSDLCDEGARLPPAAVGCLQAAVRDLSLALRAHERQREAA